MKTNDLRDVIKTAVDNFDVDVCDIIEAIRKGEKDFEIGDYRVISEDIIDEVVQEDLSMDSYMLGLFSPDFISNETGIPLKVAQVLQEQHEHEALGDLIVKMSKEKELIESYINLDGYGLHFASYDGEEQSISFNGISWYVFRIN